MSDIKGHVTPGFEPVVDTFEENFAVRGEVGAEFCAYVGGERVVNIWAGMATPDHPWTQDTLVFVFSVTKGPTALVAQILADRGLLDLDAPVARYWPEFAARGKGSGAGQPTPESHCRAPLLPRVLGSGQLRRGGGVAPHRGDRRPPRPPRRSSGNPEPESATTRSPTGGSSQNW